MSTVETSVVMVRTIEGSAEQVFAAWIDPTLIRQWLAPAPYEVSDVEVDARVGGRYRIAVMGADGTLHVTTGEYRELVPGRRLVKTWIYHDPDPSAERRETLVTVDFREMAPGVTELTLRHDRLITRVDRQRAGEGWTLCLENLARTLRRAATHP